MLKQASFKPGQTELGIIIIQELDRNEVCGAHMEGLL